ncbi:hypothetical protein KS4_02950 [Poriferisphaera corsica]|uniref:Uncharacterized protein n=2 Tax=Poriferisphaera corsica TaxID=2528020 RepID=A0A517YPV8_9BACT|nr:hypothetical protein KS4_02950 [Poriferisphaera corsica]
MRGYMMLLLMALAMMGGCASMQERALVKDSIVVGAGFEVDYTAPMDGKVYYYDRTSHRIIITKSLKKGEGFHVVSGPNDQRLQSILGVEARKARMLLYFRPDAYATPQYNLNDAAY